LLLGYVAPITVMTFTPSIAFGHIAHSTTRNCSAGCAVIDGRSQRLISIGAIQRIVAEAFNVPTWTMTARDRQEHIARPRMIAMRLARDITGQTLQAIGDAFGGRDHGTVHRACREVRDWVSVDPGLERVIEQLRQRCMGRAG
jgi:chromosomal replication initiator protein